MSNSAVQDSVDLHTFVDYLKQQQRKGETHIHLDEQAKLILREFYFKAKGITKPTPAPAPKPASETPLSNTETSTEAQTQPEATAAPKQATSVAASGTSAAAKIESLRKHAQDSATFKELTTLRDTLVFSAGNPEADIMLVGEAPGYHDEKQQTPFAGPAGKKLDGILKAMGLSREDVYLTYLVKYRPKMDNQTTNNRKPTAKEINACTPYLKQEMVVLRPKVIITLGSVPSQVMLGSKDPIDALRGKSHSIAGISTRVTYHPSYLLANDSNEDKRKVWEDMLDVMREVGLPISEKQQNYFK